MPQTFGRPGRSIASDEHRALGRVEDPLSDIAHDVMLQWTPRTGGTGNDQIVIAFPHFTEQLINNEAMSDAHANSNVEFFERFFLSDEVTT